MASSSKRVKADSKPTLKMLQRHIIPRVATKWFQLGLELFDEEEEHLLNNIESTQKENVDKCLEMFRKWISSHNNATWAQILKALKSPGIQLALADELKKNLIVLPSTDAHSPATPQPLDIASSSNDSVTESMQRSAANLEIEKIKQQYQQDLQTMKSDLEMKTNQANKQINDLKSELRESQSELRKSKQLVGKFLEVTENAKERHKPMEEEHENVKDSIEKDTTAKVIKVLLNRLSYKLGEEFKQASFLEYEFTVGAHEEITTVQQLQDKLDHLIEKMVMFFDLKQQESLKAKQPAAMNPPAMHPPAMHPPAMHPIAMHPSAMHPIAMYPPAMHPIAMHPIPMHPPAMHPIAMHPPAMHLAAMQPVAMQPGYIQPPAIPKQPVVNQCEDSEYKVATILDEKEPLPVEATEERSSKWKINSPPLLPALTCKRYRIEWTQLADLPIPLYSACTCVAVQGQKIYVAGYNSPFTNKLQHVYMYDVTTDYWYQLPSLPLYYGVPHIIDGKLCIIGGRLCTTNERTNLVVTFDEPTYSWMHYYPNLCVARSGPGVITHLKHVIVAGGASGNDDHTVLDDIEVLNWIEKSLWRKSSVRLPVPMFNLKMTIFTDSIFIVGYGNELRMWEKGIFKILSDSITISNNKDAQWSRVSESFQWNTSPLPNSSPPLIIGGHDGRRTTADIKIYDTFSTTWKSIDSLTNSRGSVAVAMVSDNAIIVMGGHRDAHDLEATSVSLVEMGQAVLL